MPFDFHSVILIGITFLAAIVNGGLGYGFSSLTVPVALLFLSSRVLSPSLVLVEVALNVYTVVMNRRSFSAVWKRMLPVLVGLVPGILVGSYFLSTVHPGLLKFFTYAVLLPLILLQAAGIRKPVRAEHAVGLPLGFGTGVLYSVTTISGPPLAIMLNNQGFEKEQFRAALGIVRVVESTLTAIAYYFLGLFSSASNMLLPFIVPSVMIGLPFGVFLIKRMNSETFRRMCMSFDAWIVGFGLSKVLIELHIFTGFAAYAVFFAVAAADLCLLYKFFRARRFVQQALPQEIGN